MLQTFALASLRQAAQTAGLPADKVMTVSVSDNIALPRPRMEYQILPARYRRTGRKLAVQRGTKDKPVQTIKRELYEVDLTVSVNILAPDTGTDADADAWLSAFIQAFVTAFPCGGNDDAGNWVRIAVKSTSYTRKPDKRIGDTVIQIFARVGAVVVLSFQGRITTEEHQKLLTNVTINLPIMGKGTTYGQEK